MVKDYLNEVSGKLPNDINMFAGGINTYMDKAFIDPDQMPYCMNMTMYQPPMMCTRASRESILFQQPDADKKIRDLWAYNDEMIFFLVEDGQSISHLHVVQKVNNGEYGLEKIFSDHDIPAGEKYFCYCRTATTEYLYICGKNYKAKVTLDPGSPDPYRRAKDYTPLDDGHYGIPAFHKGRLFFADTDTNRITFSALWDFDNFVEMPNMENPEYANVDITLVDGSSSGPPHHSGAFNTNDHVITLNGQEIAPNNTTFYYDATEKVFTFQTGNRLVYKQNTLSQNYEWMYELQDYSSYAGDFLVTYSKGHLESIASFDDKLVILSEHSMHLLYGDTPLTNSSSQFQLVDMNNNLGCISAKTVAVSGSGIFWLGDDWEVYRYTGSSIDTVSKPNSSRYVKRKGGISNISISTEKRTEYGGITDGVVGTAVNDKYYITLPMPWLPELPTRDSYLFVYDIYNKVWWAEDGNLTAIANLSFGDNRVVMAKRRDIFIQTRIYNGYDEIWQNEGRRKIPIEYEFHTRVYGADGVSSRKSLERIWLQAKLGLREYSEEDVAEADVYLLDAWTSVDNWEKPVPESVLKKIGSIEKKAIKKLEDGYLDTYDEYDYEQQECIVPKLYGQRLNTFQIVVRGRGASKYYLMKREWCSR